MATARPRPVEPEDLQSLHGAALTKLLHSAGLKKVGLSRASGISRKQINDYLGGEVIPLVKNLARLLGALDATALDYAAALHAAARDRASSRAEGESWIAQPGAPGTSQVTGGDSSYGDEPSHLYVLQSIPRNQVLLFEAGPPEQVLQALRDVLRRGE